MPHHLRASTGRFTIASNPERDSLRFPQPLLEE